LVCYWREADVLGASRIWVVLLRSGGNAGNPGPDPKPIPLKPLAVYREPGVRVANNVRICLNDLKCKAVGAGVSDKTEGRYTGVAAVAGGVDPVAVALVLAGAGREEANEREN
jgi:hypothetical protein